MEAAEVGGRGPFMAHDHAWLDGVARRMLACDREERLPRVSSRISTAVARSSAGGAPTAPSWRLAIERTGARYAEALTELLEGHPLPLRRPRVLSLCTGYDAAAELVALAEVLGPLSAYVSVDRDAAVPRINEELVGDAPEHVDQARFLFGDLRDRRLMTTVREQWGGFDLVLVVRPPVLPTRCGDLRRNPTPEGWARVDEPVLLELLGLLLDRALAPVGVLFLHAERERDQVREVLEYLDPREHGDIPYTMTTDPDGVIGHGFLLS